MQLSAWRIGFMVVLAATPVVAPDALWLSRASAVIRNARPDALTLRLVLLGETTERLLV